LNLIVSSIAAEWAGVYQIGLPFLLVVFHADHESHSFVEHVDLVELQVMDDASQRVQQLTDEWLALPKLHTTNHTSHLQLSAPCC
jgi:hypothetical protein